jgi:hypothetical protein
VGKSKWRGSENKDPCIIRCQCPELTRSNRRKSPAANDLAQKWTMSGKRRKGYWAPRRASHERLTSVTCTSHSGVKATFGAKHARLLMARNSRPNSRSSQAMFLAPNLGLIGAVKVLSEHGRCTDVLPPVGGDQRFSTCSFMRNHTLMFMSMLMLIRPGGE